MIYYFCLDAEHVAQRVAQLQSANIPHIRKDDFDTEGSGVLVSERHALAALRVWRADVKRINDANDYYGRVKTVTLETGQVELNAPHRVTVSHVLSTLREERLQNMMKSVVAPLLPHVQTDVLIHFSSGDYVDSEKYALERKFVIYFGGLRRHRRHTPHNSSPTVFGVRSERSECWDASDTANDIYDPGERRCVAELWDNKLLIIHHTPSNDALIDCQILQQIVARVVHQLSSGTVSIEDTLRDCMQSMQAEMLAYVQRTTAGRIEKRIQTTHDDIEALRNTCKNLRNDLVRKSRRLQELLQLESVLTQVRDSAPMETIAREFAALVAHPQVTNVLVTAQKLSIDTATVYCTEPNSGRRHELGNFTIEIAWDGAQAGNTTVLNHARRIDGLYPNMHAPLVDGDGRLLSKRFQESVPKLIASNAWSTILSLVLQCLETVDPNDPASKYVENWPLATQETQPVPVSASA